MKDLRKVKLSEHYDGSGAYNINGYFHRWCDGIEYDNTDKAFQ